MAMHLSVRRVRMGSGLAGMLSVLAILLTPATADAGSVQFNCGVLPPGQYCEYTGAVHDYYEVLATYPGNTGPLYITAKLTIPGVSDFAEAGGEDDPQMVGVILESFRYNSYYPLISNQSLYSHTVDGIAYW